MATSKVIVQIHERTTEVQIDADLQLRELGFISTTNVIRFNENGGTKHNIWMQDSTGVTFDNSITLTSGLSVSSGSVSLTIDDNTIQPFLLTDGSKDYIAIKTTNGLEQIDIGSSSNYAILDAYTEAMTISGYSAMLLKLEATALFGAEYTVDITTDSTNINSYFQQEYSVDGTLAMTLDSSGNVGIGTSSPDTKVHLIETALNSSTLTPATAKTLGLYIAGSGLSGSSNDVITGIAMGEGQSGVYAYDAGSSGAQGFGIFTGSNSAVTEKLRITSGGSVGIGTTSPDQALHVVGDNISEILFNLDLTTPALEMFRNEAVISSGESLGQIDFQGADNTGSTQTTHARIRSEALSAHASGDNPTELQFWTTPDGSSTMIQAVTIADDGSLGIGITDPGSIAHADADNLVIGDATDANVGLTIASTTLSTIGFADAADNNIGRITYSHTSNGMAITTNDSTAIFIDSSQKVGLGTISPSANADLTLEGGAICLKETTTPTADTNYGKVYTKTDNKLYFQDGAGTEHEIAFV